MANRQNLEEIINLPPRIMRLSLPGTEAVTDVLRLDELHPLISGNKWFKLKYSLEAAKAEGKERITTFGGAFSNHIVATACACKLYGTRSRGIIRGEESETPTPTLQTAREYGMELEFISRAEYKALRTSGFRLKGTESDYIIPEGGADAEGVRGAAEILDFVPLNEYTHILCAIGTGATAAGLLQRMNSNQQLICINVLKGGSFQRDDILRLSGKPGNNLMIRNEFHFGGYAKYTPELIRFMNEFYGQTGIPSDMVYTAKLFYAGQELVKEELNSARKKILLIHCGGLQGNASLPKGTLIF